MARPIKKEIYISDFETTVYQGQTDTKVWAAAIVPLAAPDETESVTIYGCIEDLMRFCFSGKHKVVYFHNLKFDGSFILNWILKNENLRPALTALPGGGVKWEPARDWEIKEGTYITSISDKGMWYSIRVRYHGVIVEFRDSLKLLPFSVRAIGKGFDTKHKKLEMEYKGLRYPNCPRTPEEDEYIANDVLVVKEAIAWMLENGHDKLTIGSCCMDEYKRQWIGQWYDFFPDLYSVPDESGTYGSVGDYIRKSYHGGWCYCVPERAGKLVDKDLGGDIAGTTADVNSLYPSMMHSDSGNYFPIGKPTYFKGKPPKEIVENPEKYYYFIRVKCHFEIKKGYLPTVQIKGSLSYPGREWLTSSDVQHRGTGETEYARAELVLTMTDWEMLQKHYKITALTVIDGYYFLSIKGIFDDYINKYAKIKQTSKGAMRTLAKLFLNNLYGKFATSTDSSFKVGYLDEDDVLRFRSYSEHDKKPGYIPIGSAITSYARRFTITAAQMNYRPGKRGFIYADTDSIHCDLLPEEIQGAPEHKTAFNHWKYESCWSCGWFLGAKRYAELHTYEDREKLEQPAWYIKCAGMGQASKDIFIRDMEEGTKTIKDFRVGMEISGTLKARQIPGGVLLVEGTYKMHPVNKWI